MLRRIALTLSLIFTLCVAAPVNAQMMMTGVGPVNSFVASCSASTNFLARTSGLNTTHRTAYDTLICGLVSDGVWSKFDAFYVLATQDSTTALLNLVSSSYTANNLGSTTFTADSGIAGIDSSIVAALDTTFNPATAGGLYAQNSAHLAAWSLNNTNSGAGGGVAIGYKNGSSQSNIFPKYNDGKAYFRLNGGGTSGVTIGDGRGLFVVNRPSSSTVEGYYNGASVLSTADTSATLVSRTVFMLAMDNDGTTSTGFAGPMSSASIGSSLSASDVSNYYGRICTYIYTITSGSSGCAPVTSCTDADNFLARTSGLDFIHTNAYKSLICGLVTDSVWSKIDALYVFAAQNSTTAILNLKSSTYNATIVGTPTFTTDRGFNATDGGTGSYIDTNFNPTTASSPNYVQNSAHMASWSISTSGSNNPCCGASNTTNAYLYTKYSGDSSCYSRINNTGSVGPNPSCGDPHGLEIGNRSGASATQIYLRGSSLATASDSSSTPPNAKFTALGIGLPGTVTTVGNQYAAYGFGSSLSSTDVTNYTNRMNTYMGALGITNP